jgi:dnd system-associated protein 4
MGDTRIKVAKDKAALVRSLKVTNEDRQPPFQTYVEVLVFAAALGFRYHRKTPLGEICRKEPDPIPRENFREHEKTIDLLAVVDSQDPKILSKTEECEERRIRIFEEYANAGLAIIGDRLDGIFNYSDNILLLLDSERQASKPDSDEIDLSHFLSM